MKSTTVAAAAAALAGGVQAAHRHGMAHQDLFAKRDGHTCGCKTQYATVTGKGELYTPPVVNAAPLPTGWATTCSKGTYDFPASTITLKESTWGAEETPTSVPSAGVWTLGGVTTVVDHSTEFVCSYATHDKSTVTVTSTTFLCSEAGTYTIGPHTTSVSKPGTVLVPHVTSWAPGTYTKPAAKITVTEEDYVYWCGWSSEAWSTATSYVTETKPTATATATPKTKVQVQAQTSSAPKASATAVNPISTSNGSSPALGGSGNRWGITLSPYDDGGNCKSASTIKSQMAEIAAKGLQSVRIYSTDCDSLANFGAGARAAGLKLIVGVWVSENGCENSSPDVATQIEALAAWKDHDLVELVVVTNEAMFNNWCTVDQVKNLITETKTKLRAVGWTAPFTTTDTVGTWVGTRGISALCSVMDVIACNAYAFFNAETLPEAAGVFVAAQLALVEAVCPGLDGYVMETGWPSSTCQCYGEACGSSSNQATAISSILKTVGDNVILLSAFDEKWKAPGPYCAEQNWGCLNAVPS